MDNMVDKVKRFFVITGITIVAGIVLIVLFPIAKSFFFNFAYAPGTDRWWGLKDIMLFTPLALLAALGFILIRKWWRDSH
jgi:hypothetical protein